MTASLAVSLVVYELDPAVLANTLSSLQQAIVVAREKGDLGHVQLTLVDNADHARQLETLLATCLRGADNIQADIISGHGNIGFGQAHNLVIHRADCDYYLILNPDVVLQPESLSAGVGYLHGQLHCVAASPAISNGEGQQESGCKRYPSVLDFLLRGFAPTAIKRRFAKRLAHYEMRDLPADRVSDNIPIISGCFMLFRHSALRQLGGFDPNYFLYFEDFDLSMRAHRLGTLSYLPAMQITHLGGNAAGKGWRHIMMFGRSALRFFNTHGWRLL